MNRQQQICVYEIYRLGEPMDFKAIADKRKIAHGTVLGVLEYLKRIGIVYELQYAEGVYDLTASGRREAEAME